MENKRVVLKNQKKKIQGYIDIDLANEIKEEAKLSKVSMGHVIEYRLFQLKKLISRKIKP